MNTSSEYWRTNSGSRPVALFRKIYQVQQSTAHVARIGSNSFTNSFHVRRNNALDNNSTTNRTVTAMDRPEDRLLSQYSEEDSQADYIAPASKRAQRQHALAYYYLTGSLCWLTGSIFLFLILRTGVPSPVYCTEFLPAHSVNKGTLEMLISHSPS